MITIDPWKTKNSGQLIPIRLRARVGEGLLPDRTAPLGDIADVVARVGEAGDGSPRLPGAAICAIALIANGLGALDVARNAAGGLRLDSLRDGPLDKKGAGSGILDANARVVRAELDRLEDVASDRVDADGRRERCLALDDLRRMMDATFERAAERRRDRPARDARRAEDGLDHDDPARHRRLVRRQLRRPVARLVPGGPGGRLDRVGDRRGGAALRSAEAARRLLDEGLSNCVSCQAIVGLG